MSATATGGHERGLAARRRGPRVPARLLRLASDERLVEALRGGNDAAFEVLYTRHHRGILSFCRHMLGSAEEAEDAVQHTFLAAYRHLQRTDKPIQLRPWLYTIARNRCLSVLRARRERVGDEPLEPSTEHLAQEVERRHDLRALLGDLAGLPHDQRAALVLAELGDMSHDEIGHVLGCPRERVKALVFQARSSLIASRTARETPCAEVRELLANLRGGSLRRNTLRRHLRECPGCRAYRDEVAAQRNALALILPVAPSLGLKATVLGAAGVTAAAGGGSAVVATGLVALCVAGGGAATVKTVSDDPAPRARPAETRPATASPAAAPTLPPSRGAAVTPVVAGDEAMDDGAARRTTARGPKAKTGRPDGARGPKPETGRPAKARGPKAKADRPANARGPKPKAGRPANARGPKASNRGNAATPKPKAVKPVKAPERAETRAAPPKASKPAKPPKPAESEPAPPAAPPGDEAQPEKAKG